jgi:hypothetical protein
MQTVYLRLADGILLLHAGIVLFVICALPLIWVGRLRRWQFVSNFGFRMTHLVLIGFVAAQSLLGAMCPLTLWESGLRAKAGADSRYADGFIAHWVQWLLFYDCAGWIFTVAYVGFFVLVLATCIFIPPRPPNWWTRRKQDIGRGQSS